MAKKAKAGSGTRQTLAPGDFARVKLSGGGLGPTLYKVAVVDGFYCAIHPVNERGTLDRAQRFDTELLQKVEA